MRDPLHVASRSFLVGRPARNLNFAPPSWARAGKRRVSRPARPRRRTLLVPGFSAPAFYLGYRRRCPAPLFYAARHLGSATCIGNPPDPS